MANKRARDRQLAKLAARRQAERRAAQRRRSRIVGAVTVLLVVGLGVAGFALLTGGDGTPGASATPSATASASATGPSPKPTETGTVKNQADIPTKVACGGTVPKAAGQAEPQYSNVPPEQIDPAKTYTATIATSCGDIEVKLDPADTPIAVNNFVFLAQKGFYDGLWFHRIVPSFVIQGGDPLGTGSGGPGYQFTTESNAKLTYTGTGYLLAYANSGPDTNGSQLFITIGPQPNLDPPQGPYTAFGQVTKGQDVVDEIAKVPVKAASGGGEKSTPEEAVYIESVTVTESKT
jgi:cyclophilin family peptidyl-prolyl cis-trans isomerase